MTVRQVIFDSVFPVTQSCLCRVDVEAHMKVVVISVVGHILEG